MAASGRIARLATCGVLERQRLCSGGRESRPARHAPENPEKSMAEVCVLGLGYVGLPTASLLASAGFQVLGVDIDPEVVAALNEGRTKLRESGLATVVTAAFQSRNLVAATAPEPSHTFILCVPTPLDSRKGADLGAVRAAAPAVAP